MLSPVAEDRMLLTTTETIPHTGGRAKSSRDISYDTIENGESQTKVKKSGATCALTFTPPGSPGSSW
jgi:hypothetical protein